MDRGKRSIHPTRFNQIRFEKPGNYHADGSIRHDLFAFGCLVMKADVGVDPVDGYDNAQEAAKAYCREPGINKNL